MLIATYSFRIRFSFPEFHELPHECFFLDAATLVGRIDYFWPRDRCNMSAGFAQQAEVVTRWPSSRLGYTLAVKTGMRTLLTILNYVGLGITSAMAFLSLFFEFTKSVKGSSKLGRRGPTALSSGWYFAC